MRSTPYAVRIFFIVAGFWWLLSGGDLSSWLVGGPAVILAGFAISRLSLADAPTLSWWAIARLVPYFIRESLRGGLRVGLCILTPNMPLNPERFIFTTRLSSPQARVFFLTCINLLPGTLVACLDNARLTVHVLDNAADLASELSLLEDKVARVFGGPWQEQAI